VAQKMPEMGNYYVMFVIPKKQICFQKIKNKYSVISLQSSIKK
jgi:hypothetical protein